MSFLRHLTGLMFALLLSVLSAVAMPMAPFSASQAEFFSYQEAVVAGYTDIHLAARAPPIAAANVAITGAAVDEQGNSIIMHGHEIHVVSLGFGTDFDATNTRRPPVTNPTAQQVAAANDLGVDARWVRADGSIDWPPNNGFAGTPEVVNLQPGARIDRYGSNNSGFLSPAGTPFEQRALPNSSANSQFQTFEVVRPLSVNSGQAAPWFGQPGGGTQYQLQGVNVQQLLNEGYLRVVN